MTEPDPLLDAFSKLGYAQHYLKRAVESLNSLTESEIEAAPYFVKFVKPNVVADAQQSIDWLERMRELIRESGNGTR